MRKSAFFFLVRVQNFHVGVGLLFTLEQYRFIFDNRLCCPYNLNTNAEKRPRKRRSCEYTLAP